MVATTARWHWQERFQPLGVEDACRLQIFKIHRSKSYNHWLKEKADASKAHHVQEADSTSENDAKNKQEVIAAAFQDFLKRKREQARKTKKQQQQGSTQQKDNSAEAKPWRKPPSTHVNPKTKGSVRKAECAKLSAKETTSAPYLHHDHSEAECRQAYDAWLARVRQEDLVRRAQRREELDRLEQQQRDKHKITWKKKIAVCAYSTLAGNS